MPERPGLSPEKRALLQKFLRGAVGSVSTRTARIGRRPPDTDVPLSSNQEHRWLSARSAPGVPIDTDFITVAIRAPLHLDAFRRALNEIVLRHEILRTRIAVREGEPRQVIESRVELALPSFDLSSLDPSVRQVEAIRLATSEARRPFQLAGDLLWRALLVHLGDQDHRFFLFLHHLVADCYSAYHVLLTELATAYSAFVARQPAPLSFPVLQYGDYATWQRSQPATPLTAEDRAFWDRRLDPARATRIPTDHTRIGPRTFEGAVRSAVLSPTVVGALETLSREEGATLFMALLAGFMIVVRDRTGADEVVVATETGNRQPAELERVLGLFLNPLLLHTELSGDPSFRELVSRVREEVTEAIARDKAPFQSLLEQLGRSSAGPPLYHIMFRVAPPYPILAPGWEVSAVDIDPMTSKVDLTIDFYHLPRGMVARLEYDSRLFEASTLVELLDDLIAVLENGAADPARRITVLCPAAT